MLEVELGQERVGGGRDRHVGVVGNAIERNLAEAHLVAARIDVARHAAAVAGVRHEQDARATLLELLDEVIELSSDDPLLRSGGRRGESGQQEHAVHAVGLRALHVLRLLRAVSRDREQHEIARRGAREQRIDRTQNGIAVRRVVDQRRDVRDTGATQRALDVARIGHRALERPDVAVGIDADHQRAHLALVRAAQHDRLRARGASPTRWPQGRAEAAANDVGCV